MLVLLDWKTSSALWPEYELQVSAYANAVKELRTFEKFFQAYPFFCGLLRIGSKHKSKYEFRVMDTSEVNENFRVFNACIHVANHQEKDFEPKIEEIPWSFHYKMPVAEVVEVLVSNVTKEVITSEGDAKVKPLKKRRNSKKVVKLKGKNNSLKTIKS